MTCVDFIAARQKERHDAIKEKSEINSVDFRKVLKKDLTNTPANTPTASTDTLVDTPAKKPVEKPKVNKNRDIRLMFDL